MACDDWKREQDAARGQWVETRTKKCTEERDDGYNQCTQERDDGYNQCTQERDDGYNQCTQERDDGYNQCCDWWPCSWGCKALVWVSNIVCVAWIWVKNVVCVAWTWVKNIVCVAWTWIKNIVCVAWTWVVDKIWLAGVVVAWGGCKIYEVVFGLPAIPIPADKGWLTTLSKSEPSGLMKNNNVEVLIDGMDALDKIVQEINRAESAINLLQLFWVPEFVATFTGGRIATNATRPKDVLVNALLNANRRGVVVRILLNENAVTPDTYDEIGDFFIKADNNTVSVRRFPLTLQTMHAKTLIADGKVAFIIGSPFEQGYWDTREHSLVEPRRGTAGLVGIGDRPVHDVYIRLRGPAVADVEENFRALWNFRSDAEFRGADKIDPITPPAAMGTQTIQVVRSIPRRILPELPKGELGILEAYQRAIDNAQSFIYLENQYFTSRAIVDALLLAIKRKSDLQVILLINEKPDIPTYRQWQNYWLAKVIGFPHPQIGVFTLWNTGLAAGQVSLQRCYVHSKAAIVDDKWATVGTANLDGISLEQAFEFGPIGRNRRSVEINAVLLDGIAGQPTTGNVLAMRNDLWAEHLGLNIPLAAPTGGWLTLWQSVANANVASLNANPPTMKGRILPYSLKSSDKDQLRSLGIDVSQLHILS